MRLAPYKSKEMGKGMKRKSSNLSPPASAAGSSAQFTLENHSWVFGPDVSDLRQTNGLQK